MRHIAAFIHFMLAAASLSAFVVFLIGRVCTDRFLVTQYLFWIPTLALLAAAASLALGAWLFGLVRFAMLRSRSYTAVQPPRLAHRMAIAGILGAVLIAVFVGLIEWRSWRYVFSAKPVSAAHPERSLVVIHWNMTFVDQHRWDEYVAAIPVDPLPDVVVITNPLWAAGLSKLAERFGPDYKVSRVGASAVVSRLPIVRTGASTLGITSYGEGPLFDAAGQHDATVGELLPSWSPISRVGGSIIDPGNLICIELDASASLGRSIVIWGIDLPSDIRLSRYAAAKQAAATIAKLQSPPKENPGATGKLLAPLPSPDIVLGDFNTPRGSASLSLYAPGMTHAFYQAGRGYFASWPRERRAKDGHRIPNPFPIFQIDHLFLGPTLRAAKYELLNPGVSEHFMQRAVITTRE